MDLALNNLQGWYAITQLTDQPTTNIDIYEICLYTSTFKQTHL